MSRLLQSPDLKEKVILTRMFLVFSEEKSQDTSHLLDLLGVP